ncbi:MAG TPA: M48 family metalloprotease [Gemmata sp.]
MAKRTERDIEDLSPEETEPKERPKAKAAAGARGHKEPKEPQEWDAEEPTGPRSGATERAAIADGPEPKSSRRPKGAAPRIPYPPGPEEVPEGLTDYPESFTRQQNIQLAGLILFLTFYIGAVLFFALVGFWCVWTLGHWVPIKIGGLVLCSLGLLFLVKGFFKRHPIDKDMNIELEENDHPVLFGFIRRLCEEVGSAEPNRVFVAPNVNAMCISHVSLFNLFIEPKKDLLIGLGLVNAVNLSEFKAILAHEFGHFTHTGQTSNYAHIMQCIIVDMIRGEDWLDRFVIFCKRTDALRWLGYTIGGPLWLGRVSLARVFKMIVLQNMAVSREQEFHADLVAVSAAGSDAATHGLLRARFGMQCFAQAVNDLAVAVDHKLYSNDLYLHQDRAASVVRRKKKEPDLGLPPALPHPGAGKALRVFDAEQDEIEDQDDTLPMWRSHPSDADREENAKERFVASPIDHRSPWLVFDNADELRERMTYKFYRMAFKVPKSAELSDATEVQKFIDNEHADTAFAPRYKGGFDERPLEPGDLYELNGLIRNKPWSDDRMDKVLEKLYDGCEEHAEARFEILKDLEALRSSAVGRPSGRLKRKIAAAEEQRDENWEWFKSFDRRVYLLHVQMAARVAPELKNELVERYRFQLEVQRLYVESLHALREAERYYLVHAHLQEKLGDRLSPEFTIEVLRVLRDSWKALKNIIKTAREINLPAMKNFEEGENLADFILEGKMVPEPPLTYAKGTWVYKLRQQLQGVRQKCFRLHFKSVGGILRLQEEIAAKWVRAREPIGAELVEVATVTAGAVTGEVSVDLIEAEVIEAEVLTDEPPVPVPAPERAPGTAPSGPGAPPAVAAGVPPVPGPEPKEGTAPERAPVALPQWVLDMSDRAPAAAPAVVLAPGLPTGPVPPASGAFALSSCTVPEPEPVTEQTVTGASAEAPEPARHFPSGELCSLGADELASGSAPPSLELEPAPALQGVIAAEVIEAPDTMNRTPATESDPVAPPPAPVTQPTVSAEPNPAGPALSGVTGAPAPRARGAPELQLDLDGGADLGFPGAPPVPGLKPANGKRPAVRITVVPPGARSPLAK